MRDRSQRGSNALLPLDGLPQVRKRCIRGPIFADHQESGRTRYCDLVCMVVPLLVCDALLDQESLSTHLDERPLEVDRLTCLAERTQVGQMGAAQLDAMTVCSN